MKRRFYVIKIVEFRNQWQSNMIYFCGYAYLNTPMFCNSVLGARQFTSKRSAMEELRWIRDFKMPETIYKLEVQAHTKPITH